MKNNRMQHQGVRPERLDLRAVTQDVSMRSRGGFAVRECSEGCSNPGVNAVPLLEVSAEFGTSVRQTLVVPLRLNEGQRSQKLSSQIYRAEVPLAGLGMVENMPDRPIQSGRSLRIYFHHAHVSRPAIERGHYEFSALQKSSHLRR